MTHVRRVGTATRTAPSAYRRDVPSRASNRAPASSSRRRAPTEKAPFPGPFAFWLMVCACSCCASSFCCTRTGCHRVDVFRSEEGKVSELCCGTLVHCLPCFWRRSSEMGLARHRFPQRDWHSDHCLIPLPAGPPFGWIAEIGSELARFDR
uniref:(northern house mosquito) hypothetical protein n=1 Tax=Culex pipiens TaxID=7175 RepID=A0A8D8DPG9_CULPI